MNSLVLSLAMMAPTGWGSACVAVAAPVMWSAPAQILQYQWKLVDDVHQLWYGQNLVGGYRDKTRKYYALVNGQWVEAVSPVAPPSGSPLVEQNYGLELDKIQPQRTYKVGDKQVSREVFMEAMKLPDDAMHPFLTVIGPGGEDVKRDLAKNPKLAELAKHFRVQFYDKPENPIVGEAGFVKTGSPTIYMQKADGEVLHRQDEYRGPEKLAEAMAEAVRKADPHYDPKKDPDLNSSIKVPEWLNQVPWWAWGLGAAVAVALIVKRKEPNGL